MAAILQSAICRIKRNGRARQGLLKLAAASSCAAFIFFPAYPIVTEFKFPKDGILTLHNGLDDLHHYGRLGKKMGDGIFGIVYDITGSWSTHTKEHVVAKWFKFDISPKGTSPDQNPAIQEILNLQDVHELVDYGLMIDISSPNDVPHTWAILKWKNGVFFDELPEFKTIIQGLDRKKCEDLMEEAREAIVEASRKYIRLPGAPSHTFVYIYLYVAHCPYTHTRFQRYSHEQCAVL